MQSPINQYSFGFSVFLNWAALHSAWSDQNPDIVNYFPNMKREFLRTHLWRVPEGIWKVSSLQGRSSFREDHTLSLVSDSLRPHGLQPIGLLCPCDSPGKNTGLGSHSLLQGIFLTQGSNPGLLHCRQILYCLSHQRINIKKCILTYYFNKLVLS